MTQAPTLPVLAHRDGKRHVIVVHPALPPPAGDVERDAAVCREALTPLIETYVRRFPAQWVPRPSALVDGAGGRKRRSA